MSSQANLEKMIEKALKEKVKGKPKRMKRTKKTWNKKKS